MAKESEPSKRLNDIIEIEGDVLSLEDVESIALDDTVRALYEEKYGDHLYSSILKSLTHRTFREQEARSLWREIVDHRNNLNKALGRDVGLSVAALDYLSNIKGRLSEPKIIEENKSAVVTEAATKDETTGLHSREVFDVVINKEIEQAKRSSTPVCLLMIDIDDFKAVNDRHGHLIGDDVLRETGRVIADSVREMDLAARYGGEEFAIIMPGTGIDAAARAGERIRRAVEEMQLNGISVTVSIGVSRNDRFIDTPEKMIDAADDALYRAKSEGKNRVKTAV